MVLTRGATVDSNEPWNATVLGVMASTKQRIFIHANTLRLSYKNQSVNAV